MASTTYNYRIYGIPQSDGLRVVMFRDSASNGNTAVVYNSALEPQESVPIDSLTAFDVSSGKLYVLGRNMLYAYNSALECIKTYELDEEYSDVKIIDNSAYLLGYNSVQCVAL